jgi:betaine-aldehyde dehydrogenase
MAAWKIAPALAAGCTCVLKPSENTPLSALELAAIASRVGLPRGVFNVVNGYGPSAGTPLIEHPLVSKIAFTGSVPTGSKIAIKAAASIKKCSLELGGKSPIIVFDDADVDGVADWVSVGIFFNAGQVCSATSRLIIQEGIKDKVLGKLKSVIEGVKIGPGLDPSNKLGPLVNEVQYKKVSDFIKGGIAQGATPITGGVPVDSEGYFVKPTIFDNVKPEMTIWREEIFGPVLSVVSFKTIDEALHLANNTEYGLGAAVMSKDKETCKKVVRNLEAGIVWVNCSQPTFVQAPWGGYKQSGIGRELGPWGLENYLETKQVSTWVDEKSKGWGWFM